MILLNQGKDKPGSRGNAVLADDDAKKEYRNEFVGAATTTLSLGMLP